MLKDLYSTLGGATSASAIIISVALMLFFGFLMTRITKKLHLPNVTAYIVAGVIIGPFCLDLIPNEVFTGMEFISDVALAFIAFGVGEFFRIDTLKKSGAKVVVITLFESLCASVVVFVVTFFVFGLSLSFSLVLSALASATAPASTMMTIRQTKAKGDFVDTLLQVVALDDVVSLVAFSVAVSVATATENSTVGFDFGVIVMPIVKNLCAVLLGGISGALLKFMIP
ncbi:MAG: cation:proton antiporter, partial [Clostridia bacterium]|nr:cation:proton antiporter [Clostridia bacterium]